MGCDGSNLRLRFVRRCGLHAEMWEQDRCCRVDHCRDRRHRLELGCREIAVNVESHPDHRFLSFGGSAERTVPLTTNGLGHADLQVERRQQYQRRLTRGDLVTDRGESRVYVDGIGHEARRQGQHGRTGRRRDDLEIALDVLPGVLPVPVDVQVSEMSPCLEANRASRSTKASPSRRASSNPVVVLPAPPGPTSRITPVSLIGCGQSPVRWTGRASPTADHTDQLRSFVVPPFVRSSSSSIVLRSSFA